ncbi:MAG: MYG1 family protein [Chlamydiales bacterium]|nr:MYG1 family protein [Chlamydiales bacterium]
MSKKIPKSVGIHDGVFHADEVTAVALLVILDLVDPKKIVRTRDEKKLVECEYVCDVGGIYAPKEKLFDHHQSTYQGEMSSAGMVLTYLRDQKLMKAEEASFLHHLLVKGVDDHDNGRSPQIPGTTLFSHVIANFAPATYHATREQMDEAFHEALAFAVGHLRRLLERHRYNRQCRKIVEGAMQRGKQCLLFDEAIPWVESFFALHGKNHPALFVVMPAGEHWKLRGIPPDDEHRMQVRMPLPQEWAGLLGDDLKKASGLKGAVFCHKGRFTSVWETREDALRALEEVLEKHGIAREDDF